MVEQSGGNVPPASTAVVHAPLPEREQLAKSLLNDAARQAAAELTD
jgi:hypothetical protein